MSPVWCSKSSQAHLAAGHLSQFSLPRSDNPEYLGVQVDEGDDGKDGVEEGDRHHHDAGVDHWQTEGAGVNPTGWNFSKTNILTFNIIDIWLGLRLNKTTRQTLRLSSSDWGGNSELLFCFYPEIFCSHWQESSKNLGTLNATVNVRMERMTGREDLEIECSIVKHLKWFRPSVTSISQPLYRCYIYFSFPHPSCQLWVRKVLNICE